ncbi:hypothetical protein PIB30_117651 [Stylosanthes scabra]|uniref:PAS domain-containing protein n=1 Tax=Stylosanthes scabra TaxID=79078 RepID=A0ABU6UEG2_9FABA|nr:hypothetical protein [Stylosanthes scabra]
MVGKLVQLAARDDIQSLIVVAQLFKPSVYLNESYIQNTRYISQVFLNPDFPEVNEIKMSLLAQGEAATQGIAHVESQPQYSVEGELEGGACTITSIDDVMNLTEETSCWILAKIMSVESTPNSWCYLSCHRCFKKVQEVKNGYQCLRCKRMIAEPSLRYRLHLIVADSTGCLNLMMWNDEAKLIIGKSAKEVIASEVMLL